MIGPDWFLLIIIIGIVGFVLLGILRPFLTENGFKHFYEEYAFPTLIVCALTIGITMCVG